LDFIGDTMDRRAAWVLGILFGGLFLSLFAFMFLFYTAVRSGSSTEEGMGRGDVGVVEVTGPIGDSKKQLRQLRAFEKEARIKAVVVRVNSPGGEVGPSQELYTAIKRLSKKKKVVVSMGSLAASGGYYLACAGDKIFADPGTLTGSIGVILETPNLQGVLKWAGISMNTIKAGKMKDVGSPFRDMQPEEKAYLEAVLADVHKQFIEAVAKGRHLKISDIEPIADGRIFTGRQAKELKLVDELGGFEDAVEEAGRLAGIVGEPKLEYPHKERGRLVRELFGEEDPEALFDGAMAKLSSGLGGGLGFQYKLPLNGVP
jgi:protease-4